MEQCPITEMIDGVTFELSPFLKQPTNPDWMCLRKSHSLVAHYRAMASDLQGCNMVEVGIDSGGSTAFFYKLYRPQKLLAIELSQEPLRKLMRFLRNHDEGQRVQVCLGIDQADRVEVSRLVEEQFGNHPLDIVVDDASHLLHPSTATFEELFPRLRPGGVYLIEDWWGDHMVETAWTKELNANPDGEIAKRFAAALAAGGITEYPIPISLLICQLLVASACNPDWVAGLHAANGICEIRRGAAEIEPGTPISRYIGVLGKMLFNTPND